MAGLKPQPLLPLVALASLLVSCETPQSRALIELKKRGIEPSGQALVEAATAQDHLQIEWLLAVGVGTEQRDSSGRTPLRIAVEKGDSATANRLLDSKASVSAVALDHSSSLGVAIGRDDTALSLRLLQCGAPRDGSMPDGEKILPWATRQGRVAVVRELLKAGADPQSKDRFGDSLIHIAMAAGNREMVGSLLKFAADPTATNHAGETTIQLALGQNWPDLLPKLIAAGVNINHRDAAGFTLLERAVGAQNIPQIALLLDQRADPHLAATAGQMETPVELAIASGNPAVFRAFLNHGVRPQNGRWDRWLWRAFDQRNLEIARSMLQLGATASTRNRNGQLIAEAATRLRRGSWVKLLLDYSQPAGDSLLMAVNAGDDGMVRLLLACGVRANQTRIPGWASPLGLALSRQQDAIAVTLIEHHADGELALPEGQPALHLAIARGCHRTVQLLLQQGGNPNAAFNLPVSAAFLKLVRPGVGRWVLKHDSNVTPLMIAADSGVIPTTRHLLVAGAKTETWTRTTRFWPLNFASNRSDVRMMRLILGKDPLREDRRLEVRLSEQRARLLDAAGNELFTTKISSGRKGFATPTGEFVITNKNREWTSTLYHASMPYFQRLSCGDFGFHQGNLPGYPASHGCIRLPGKNAAKLFSLTQAGDRVTILP